MLQNTNFHTTLRRHKLKATPSRVALLGLLAKSNIPLNARQILSKFRKKFDQATLYRTLESFKDAGLVRQIDLQKVSAYYEISDAMDHHHLVCTNCGRIEDFYGCNFESLAKKALAQSSKFKEINHHSIELFGFCNLCTTTR